MELKVGDYVRWVGPDDIRDIGSRGEVSEIRGVDVYIDWPNEDGPIDYSLGYLIKYTIKEFHPGDRVVLLKRQEPYDINPGLLGTVASLSSLGGYDFGVEWDQPHSSARYHLYRYSECYVAHAPISSPIVHQLPVESPPITGTITIPAEPRRPGTCYTCGRPDSPWRSDRYMCGECTNRYQK